MRNPAVRFAAIALGAGIVLAGAGFASTVRAADPDDPPLGHPRAIEPKPAGSSAAPAAETQPAAARRTPPAPRPRAPNRYGCHPAEDIACTIVRETADGTVVVTVRSARASASAPAWSVVSGAPPAGAARVAGTIYVVPVSTAAPPLLTATNGAPILD